MTKKNYKKYLSTFDGQSILDYLGNNVIINENYESVALEIMETTVNKIKTNFSCKIKESAINALKQAYHAAKNGMASAAFENTRFFLERIALIKIISLMKMENNPYELALELIEWHKLVDKKFIIYGLQQFTGRIWHYTEKKTIPEGILIFLSGVPLCGNHSKAYAKYSRTINEIESETGLNIKEQCAKCGKEAVRFTISLPKAGAILGLLGFYTGREISDLGKYYADYSRVLHPYGFYSYPSNYLINLWSIDFIRLALKLDKIIF
ncbi:hypothetical protein [Ferroplasma sp.]|uniref:hypothetical protein n=1 Tax=Ferroplasma sp. TaxID=2591003 RepID=UPI00307ED330